MPGPAASRRKRWLVPPGASLGGKKLTGMCSVTCREPRTPGCAEEGALGNKVFPKFSLSPTFWAVEKTCPRDLDSWF